MLLVMFLKYCSSDNASGTLYCANQESHDTFSRRLAACFSPRPMTL